MLVTSGVEAVSIDAALCDSVPRAIELFVRRVGDLLRADDATSRTGAVQVSTARRLDFVAFF